MRPYKIAWYLVNYKWRKGKCKCTNMQEEKVLEATNNVGEISPLQYLYAIEEMFILGIYLTPDVNNKYQVKYMQKKETAWETSNRAEGFQRNEAWEILNDKYLKP